MSAQALPPVDPDDTLLRTPTGMLVYDGRPHTPKWYAARQHGITGTDLPKILGITKYGNALSVWLDKRGELPDEASEQEAAYWGTVFEEPVANRWAELNHTMVEPVGILAHHGLPWMRASLDRVVHTCPDGEGRGVCALEVKTRSAYVADAYRMGYPDDVLAQVAWGRAVSGFHHMHIAVLLGGQRLVQHRYDRDDELEGYLLLEAQKVWDNVKAGVPPEVQPSQALLDLLNQMYAVREGDRTLPETAEHYMRSYSKAHQQESIAKARKREAQAALVQMLDDGDRALTPEGGVAFTYRRPQPSTGISADAIRRLQKEKPGIYQHLVEQGFIVTTQGNPRFNAAFLRHEEDL